MRSGLLIIGHGTRDERGVADFLQTVRQIEDCVAATPVQPAFLELASPTIPEGVERLIAQGVRRIQAVPLLLLAAGHIRRDIPRILAQLRAEHPGVDIRQIRHLGCHPQIMELSAFRYREALASRPYVAAEETLLVLVSRGSSDKAAAGEMERFAELRRRKTAVGSMKLCFLAIQRPSLPDALLQAAAASFSRVVIQPHLLFPGTLSGQIHAEVEQARSNWPASDWVIVEPLGPHPLLAEAVRETAITYQPAGCLDRG